MFKNLFKRSIIRTLQFEILTVFLVLIFVSSSIIVGFTYVKDSKAFDIVFHRTMNKLNELIVDRIECLLNAFKIVPEVLGGFLEIHPDLAIDDPDLVRHCLDFFLRQEKLTSLFVGRPDGNALVIVDLKFTDNPYIISPADEIPTGASFLCVEVDRSRPVGDQESWHYFSQDLKELAVFKKPLSFDPRSRAWYQGVEKTGELFWTDIYLYQLTGDSGISCAVPVYDASGKLSNVVGTDVPLIFLSQFLSSQQIGKQGRAYLCDDLGKVIVPMPENKEIEALVLKAVSLHQSETNPTKEFYIEFKNKKYLTSVHPFYLSPKIKWKMVLIDPESDLFQDILDTRKQVILISLLILMIFSIFVIYFSNRISKPIVVLSKEVDKITHLNLDSNVRVISMIKEIAMMDESVAAMRLALRSFSHYVPKDVVFELMEKGKEITLGGEKKEITILFSDIQDFSSVAERVPVETLTSLLAEYFDSLSKIILSEQGTIDKYIGDGIMAFWGAPRPLASHAGQACLAALRCQKYLLNLSQKRIEQNLPPFFTRIGINTGNAIIGNVGTLERMNYTAIGDAVNLAARLQNINKIYHTKIVIGEETYIQIRDQFLVRPLDIVEVKGKKNKTKIYELMACFEEGHDVSATSELLELADLFKRAYDCFEQGDIPSAVQQFQKILEKFPEDGPTKYYLEKFPYRS
jgi:adenylate cyclase